MFTAERVPENAYRRQRGFRRGVAAAVAMAAFWPVPGILAPESAGAAAAAIPYVALGDSFTSGPSIPNQVSAGCMRSDHNYPSDTANALGLSLTDMSCGGATTANMYSPQQVSTGPANPAQLSVLSKSTQVVSLGIGANDIGIANILVNCAALTPWGPTSVGANCKNYYDPTGNDSLKAAINALASTMASLLQTVHADAAAAKVFVVGYAAIFPATGACWPSMPYEKADAQYFTQTEDELNSMLASVAGSNNAVYVDTYAKSLPYNACTAAATRWVEPLVPVAPAYPAHPNATGEAGMASLLEAAMQKAGIS